MMDAIEVVARAIVEAISQCGYCGDDGEGGAENLKAVVVDCEINTIEVAMTALAALRAPAVLEALCRSIAVGSSRIAIEIPEYGSMHVNAAVYLISAVLGAALGEGEH